MSLVWRLLPSAAICAVSTVAGGYAVNKLTSSGPAWWWAIVGVSLVGLIAGTLWGYRLQSHLPDNRQAPAASIVNQSARDVSISADNHSVAAWSVETVNMSGSP
ncbi:hypothetical protein, partial [Mycobacterium sp.]|uniref:hypothetical protein n=1 Tax=Mycobacterium sp. TaxID=1785 RepID=UPI003C76362B